MNRSIYVIRSAPGPVKVGIATNPRARLSQLRTASAVPLFMDFAAETSGDARALERRAHAILAGRRLSGEWFEVDSREAVAAVRRAAHELGVALYGSGTSSVQHPPARTLRTRPATVARGIWKRSRQSAAKRFSLFRRACWRVAITAGLVIGLPFLLAASHLAIAGKPIGASEATQQKAQQALEQALEAAGVTFTRSGVKPRRTRP
jgi:hypothetical protein